MTTIMPEGEALRRAIKWISQQIEAGSEQPVRVLVNEAVVRFDLSPKDSEFLVNFYRKDGQSHH